MDGWRIRFNVLNHPIQKDFPLLLRLEINDVLYVCATFHKGVFLRSKGCHLKNFSFAPFACLKPLFARMMLSIHSLCNLQHLVCALRELRAYLQLNYLGASILDCFVTFSCK